MSVVAVPITIAETSECDRGLKDGVRARDAGADLIEWRVDRLADDDRGPDTVERLIRESPLPSILTCRSADEGGAFEGTEAERVGLLDQMAARGAIPAYVDLEYARWIANSDLQDATAELRRLGAKIILSAHDFKGRPEKLDDIFASIDNTSGCDVTKVAWRAAGIEDLAICARKLRERPRDTIALCMGGPGLASRVFAGCWGGLLTFAALSETTGSAPGQPTLEEMIEVYRVGKINAETRLQPVFRDGDTRAENAALQATDENVVALALGSVEDEKAALEELRVIVEDR
ncbi:type I 3-dehydroquinate dehydratase [Candidatus Binatia bacterium]|nr:type I 3-dehydroquinate dehydratase [Candidatus Binatia bacterium]